MKLVTYRRFPATQLVDVFDVDVVVTSIAAALVDDH